MKLRSLVLSFVVLMSASLAFANLVPSGPAIPTGSWTQQFQESGVGPFNNFVFNIITPGVTWGDVNHPNGVDNFIPTDGYDWASQVVPGSNGKNAWAFYNYYGGPYPTSLLFDATFSTDQNVPFTAIFFAYDDQALVDHAKVEWTGSQWNITALPTPEPASLAFLATGLLGLGLRRKLS